MEADRLRWWEEIPLGLALVAQSYVVGLWYFASINGAGPWVDLVVAVGAGLALDLIVVTTVMGRRAGRSSGWSWATSLGAFVCSSLIALDRYGWEWRSGLHIAFPLVVFLYSQHLATPRKRASARPVQAVDEIEEALGAPALAQMAQATQRVAGFVYVLRSEAGQCKIGCARDVEQRTRQIAAFVPFKAEVVHTIATDDMYATEGRLHRYFDLAGKRLNGEWFALTSVDLSAIRAISAGKVDAVFDRALELLASAGVKDKEFDGAFWLQQATAKKPIILPLIPASAPLPTNGTHRYECPHCHAPLEKKQAIGAAVKNGYCPACKVERLS